jgi:hypothetical protein
MSTQENRDRIIDILEDKSDLSATAIAHELGFSKASSIKSELDALVDEGVVTKNSDGRFDTFSLGEKKSIEKPQVKTTVVEGEKVTEKLPEAPLSDIEGFKIANIRYKGARMKKITTPDGKNIRLEDDEKLIVINDQPKYVVKSAEDIIACIQKYAMDEGLTVFSVNDIKQNRKITTEKDLVVKDNHIISLSIKKHNKAA